MSKTYTVNERAPSVAEYNRVRGAAGLSVKDEVAAARGLANSLYAVCIMHNGEAIGIGRVIGDGGLFYDIVDIAVVASHQKQGVGKMIMDALMAYVHVHAPATALITLQSNKGVAPFYEQYGFKARDADMPAMNIRK